MIGWLRRHPLLLALAALPLAAAACLCVGSVPVRPWAALAGDDPAARAILLLRALRLAAALVVGGALATAGAAYQAVLRNPLAGPYVLGISGGAGLGVAVALHFRLYELTPFALPAAGFAGAVAVLAAVLLMARGAGAEYTHNVMLSGVIVGTVCSSALMFLISVMNLQTMHNVTWWMLGNLQPADTGFLRTAALVTLAGAAVLWAFGREANALSLGEEMAYYLGLPPKRAALILLGVASLLTATAVALGGIIGFVGLVAPHVLRRLFGADHRTLFPLALLWGGIFLALCDAVARSALGAQEIPAGVVTAFVGGPFFLWLLNRRRREG
ncbi:MAG: iron ABC transporter permease [Lentisphaeria bacterium]|jgi:iron complex transport system permease protein